MRYTGNIIGAFADGAILFPLLVALVWQTGMDGAILLASAGAAYLAAGFVFRIPMSVQPLKSVVVAALALGASAAEIYMSGLAIGGICLLLSFCWADRFSAIVPRHLVQGLQLGLGIILMLKGFQWGMDGLENSFLPAIIFIILSGIIVVVTIRFSLPIIGWVATGGLLFAVFFAIENNPVTSLPIEKNGLRPDIILALVLPQLALTLTNSVVATHDVAQHYFGSIAKNARPSWLLRSIGIGNILSAAAGGLPFCHGSGGLTAHVKGGAQSWHMNLIIGGFLLVLAVVSGLSGMALIPSYPKILMAILIFATGFFHLQLAKPSWKQPSLRFVLVAMGATALLTHNMLWVLGVGVVIELLNRVSLFFKVGKAARQ
ncbi:MAG: hypothetical protein CO093_09490 [Alphaproteobacteria bacterium CG_4_9_14_3_um_filter_47_13]|nr:MAG: hypothetical protein CO093_09490 [Alphaproteobacteria bacterium CG_4_9_14_3_um_filter_47_13]